MTIKGAVESCMRILKGGNLRSSSNLHENDVKASLSRAVNAVLKMESVMPANPFMSTAVPTHHLAATYENIPVTDIDCDRSTATLPVTPISLPLSMGVWSVYDCLKRPIIPLEMGMLNMAEGVTHTGLSAMLGEKLLAYELQGNKLTFNKPKAIIGDTVTMVLLVVDMLTADEYSQLPVPPDMEAKVFEMVKIDLQPRPHDDSADGNDKP